MDEQEKSLESQNINNNKQLKPYLEKVRRMESEGKVVKTKNFGWVLTKDYENSRFSFLKTDRGVPFTRASFKGNSNTITIKPEYEEYKELLKKRSYAASMESDYEQSIVNDTKPEDIPF